MPSSCTNLVACGALASGALLGAHAFVAPSSGNQVAQEIDAAVSFQPAAPEPAMGWSAAAGVSVGAIGALGAVASTRGRRQAAKAAKAPESTETTVAIGKGGCFAGATAESLTVLSMCPRTGRVQAQQLHAGVAMAAGPSTKVAINGRRPNATPLALLCVPCHSMSLHLS